MASPKEDLIRNLRNESLELEDRIQSAEYYLQKHPEDGQVHFYQGDLLYRRAMQKNLTWEEGFSKACETLFKARDNLETEKEKKEAQRFLEIVLLSSTQLVEEITEEKKEDLYSFVAKNSTGETSQAACLWLAQIYGSKENPDWEKAGHYASEYLHRKKKDPNLYAAVPVAKKILKETGLIDEKGEYTTTFDSEKFKKLALGIEPGAEEENEEKEAEFLLNQPHTYKVQVLLAMELLKSGHEEEAALSLEKAYRLVRQLGEEQSAEAEKISAALPELMRKAMRESSQPEVFAGKILEYQRERKQSLDLEASLQAARACFRDEKWLYTISYYQGGLFRAEVPEGYDWPLLQIKHSHLKITKEGKKSLETKTERVAVLPEALDLMLQQGDLAALLFACYMTYSERLVSYQKLLEESSLKGKQYSTDLELCKLVFRLNLAKKLGIKYFRKKNLAKVFGYNPLEIKNENPIFRRIQKQIEEDLVRKFFFERKGK